MAAKKKAAPKKEELVTVTGHKDFKVAQFISDTFEDYGCASYYDALDKVCLEFGLMPGTTLTAGMIKKICEFLMVTHTEYLGELTSMLENYYPTAISFSNEYIREQTIQGLCPYCGDGALIFYGDRIGADRILAQDGLVFNCSECDAEIHINIEEFTVYDNS